ncbi:DUF2161 family putative PD-(D/E)XK-type phosphodiesterase [Desulfovibrio inopinatus]|uniref:DUF2161 family putative PD-(D/E)XK-type phosphodiesterase n=1 Tax=Desulfovibrio inopinatus TaxID=102109 RepID=UPI000429D19B|nr:DUF2161 family putative PD-(D/E)XK-type phosphodiesterase [Desulfovibrio inopinatus]
MKETDLYPPLKRFLEGQHYEVKSEVMDCDVVALRGDEPPLVIELKCSLRLDVVLQAVDRLAVSPHVYIGIPFNSTLIKRRRKHVLKLLRMLGLGLLVINPEDLDDGVTVLLDPGPYTPRKSTVREQRLLKEFSHRVGDPNMGGAQKKRGIVTAYRQKAVAIAQFLAHHGPSKASSIAHALDEPKTRNILYSNVYGWFERVDRGIYTLSPRGTCELPLWIETGEHSP